MGTPFNPVIEQIATNGYHRGSKALFQVLTEIHEVDGNGTNYLYAACMAAAPALDYIAKAIANGGEDERDNGHIKARNANKETALVAGLLLARCIKPTENGITMDFSPRNVMAAVEAAKLVSGDAEIEKHISPPLLRQYGSYVKEENQTLGYWDYLDGVGPDFSEFGANIVSFSTTKH